MLELMAKGGHGGSLELAVVPTLATKWLLPRVPVSNDKYPNITVNLTVHTRPFLFDDTEFDAAVHAGAAIWPGTEGTFLMRENLIAVCSPGLIALRARLTAADWRRYPLRQQRDTSACTARLVCFSQHAG